MVLHVTYWIIAIGVMLLTLLGLTWVGMWFTLRAQIKENRHR